MMRLVGVTAMALGAAMLSGPAARAQAAETGAAPSRPPLIVHERDLAVDEPGPHDGGGPTTAYPFFADADGLELVFRKRALHAGSAIGVHPHDHDEIYYVLSGNGVYTLDGEDYAVGPGDAMLVRDGDSHGIRPAGADDLVLLIMYREPKP